MLVWSYSYCSHDTMGNGKQTLACLCVRMPQTLTSDACHRSAPCSFVKGIEMASLLYSALAVRVRYSHNVLKQRNNCCIGSSLLQLPHPSALTCFRKRPLTVHKQFPMLEQWVLSVCAEILVVPHHPGGEYI